MATLKRDRRAASRMRPAFEAAPAELIPQKITPRDKRTAFVQGLRELAAFIEAHPDLPVPHSDSSVGPYLGNSTPDTDQQRRAEVDRIASILGVTTSGDSHYKASRRFGPIAYTAVAISSAVMERHAAHMSYYNVIQPADCTS
ncbi:hypothetical protein [Spirillospora sp. CA-128828]|uniref:hypothetical protein n=1 Tax=Spirillospora sp. CA-128828 TaxID=3240033 RepID=UPI003D938FEE